MHLRNLSFGKILQQCDDIYFFIRRQNETSFEWVSVMRVSLRHRKFLKEVECSLHIWSILLIYIYNICGNIKIDIAP